MNREPLLTLGSIVTAVTALITLLAAFGLPLSNDQQSAVLGVVAVVAPLVLAFLARPKVTPVADPKSNDGEPLVPAALG